MLFQFAVIVLFIWLLFLGMLTGDLQYGIWAALVILLWAQPWSLGTPTRRGGLLLRLIVGVGMMGVLGLAWLMTEDWRALLYLAEIFILLALELRAHWLRRQAR